MKRLTLAILLLPLSLFAQKNMGQIIVNMDNSATLKFFVDIQMVVFGNNPQIEEGIYESYDFFTHNDICLIRANHPGAKETSIMVYLVDNTVYYGTVNYGNNTPLFYSFNEPEPTKQPVQPVTKAEIKTAVDSTAIIENALKRVVAIPDEFFSLVNINSGIQCGITVLRNDHQTTYLKLSLHNNSSGLYDIDGIFFRYVQGKAKGVKRRDAEFVERLHPKKVIGANQINPYTKETIGMAIPLFTVENKGYLEISISDKNGTRDLLIKIPARIINKIKIIQSGNGLKF